MEKEEVYECLMSGRIPLKEVLASINPTRYTEYLEYIEFEVTGGEWTEEPHPDDLPQLSEKQQERLFITLMFFQFCALYTDEGYEKNAAWAINHRNQLKVTGIEPLDVKPILAKLILN